MAKKFSKPELSRKINGDIPFDTTPDSEETTKIRLDIATLEQYPRYSRATIQKFIKNGQVTVNGDIIDKPNTMIDENAKINLRVENAANGEKPEVLYEDDDVIVFNKPAGMLTVSKGEFNPEPTLEQFGEIVHRLDRDTSGLIILAKNAKAKSFLQKQFQERKAHKTYYAVTVGHPKVDHAIINIPLTRNLKKPTTFMVANQGREAITEYRVIDQNEKYSLIELKPQTGRTHQLRIHLAHIGAPILGDPVYNPKSPKADRMYLHASILEITVPSGKRLTFTANLPEEFRNVVR